jgi:hypothetical protein
VRPTGEAVWEALRAGLGGRRESPYLPWTLFLYEVTYTGTESVVRGQVLTEMDQRWESRAQRGR